MFSNIKEQLSNVDKKSIGIGVVIGVAGTILSQTAIHYGKKAVTGLANSVKGAIEARKAERLASENKEEGK